MCVVVLEARAPTHAEPCLATSLARVRLPEKNMPAHPSRSGDKVPRAAPLYGRCVSWRWACERLVA
eukprot:8033140-Alexandrium_andersonii.AAC.1